MFRYFLFSLISFSVPVNKWFLLNNRRPEISFKVVLISDLYAHINQPSTLDSVFTATRLNSVQYFKWHHRRSTKTTCLNYNHTHTMRLSTFRKEYLHTAVKWSNWKCIGSHSRNTSRIIMYISFVKHVNMIECKLFYDRRMVKVRLGAVSRISIKQTDISLKTCSA